MNVDGTRTLADHADDDVLDLLAAAWRRRDPVPADLAERVCFALGLDDLEVELMRLADQTLAAVGARTDERARTVTFSSDTLSVMVMINEGGDGVRLDGWIEDGAGLQVTLRIGSGERITSADTDGRFSFEAVPSGLTQLVFLPTEGALPRLSRSVVTPAIQV
jgi:hypothetical protein